MEYDGVIIKPSLDEALEHYGVAGMRWGVRKAEKNAGTRTKLAIRKYRDLEEKRKQSPFRSEKKKLKLQMKNQYANIKRAKKVDYGEKLVKNKEKRHKVSSTFVLSGLLGGLSYINANVGLRALADGDKLGIGFLGLSAIQGLAAGANLSAGIRQRYKNVSIDEFRSQATKKKQ